MDIQRYTALLARHLNGTIDFRDSSNKIWVLPIGAEVSASIAFFVRIVIQ